MAQGIRVTVTDLETGESNESVIWDDYVLVVAGSCYLDHISDHPTTGTRLITVKGRKTDANR